MMLITTTVEVSSNALLAKVGGPQIGSKNRKFLNLRTFCKCHTLLIYHKNLRTCALRSSGIPKKFADLQYQVCPRIADQRFVDFKTKFCFTTSACK
jgi:hypothetical protein